MSVQPGVLALQGSSEPHLQRLTELGAELGFTPREVRQQRDLAGLTHLVLPGGESTTIRHLLDLFGMTDEIVARFHAGELALFGTCAGAILLGQDDGTRPARLGLLDATLTRNAYGRQLDSFTEELPLELPAPLPVPSNETPARAAARPFHCVFIRAPRFTRIGAGVTVLGQRGGEPILVTAPGLLAATFHPELTSNLDVHRHFLAMSPAARA